DNPAHALGAVPDRVHHSELSGSVENVRAHGRGQADAPDDAHGHGDAQHDHDDRTEVTLGDCLAPADRVRRSHFVPCCDESPLDGGSRPVRFCSSWRSVATRSWFTRCDNPRALDKPSAVAWTLLPPPVSSAMPTTRHVVGRPPTVSCTESPACT